MFVSVPGAVKIVWILDIIKTVFIAKLCETNWVHFKVVLYSVKVLPGPCPLQA